MIRRPPRSKRTATLFPYTTLFRSAVITGERWRVRQAVQAPGIQRHGIGTVDKARHQLGHAARRNHVMALTAQYQQAAVVETLDDLFAIAWRRYRIELAGEHQDRQRAVQRRMDRLGHVAVRPDPKSAGEGKSGAGRVDL